jgi:UDP-N-acetylmuramoyl-tripeptide--D-alanyl-D-alanine ligase
MGKGPLLTGSDIVKATGGDLLRGHGGTSFLGLSTDTRTLRRGELFVALRGEHFDGHAFIQEAFEKGAAGAIVARGHPAIGAPESLNFEPLIAVSDTLRALGDIARFWRNTFSLPIVGVTGSNGKTSTKEMIALLLEERFRVLKNPGNFNNLIGLPLTLLTLEPTHKVVVLEMATNMPGEIRRLAEIARPTVGVITNIGPVHLEGMGSLDSLIREKGDLFRSIGEEGVLAVNQNDPHVSALARDCGARKIRFGIDTTADVVIDRIQWRGVQGVRFRLTVGKERGWVDFPIMGLQFVQNVAAAVAVASLFDMGMETIRRRLEGFIPLPQRMEIIPLGGVTFINDTYNANPPSMEMALRTLAQAKGRGSAFVVLGDMLELGDISQKAHQELGRLIGTLKVTGAFLLGDHASHVAEGATKEGMDPRKLWILGTHQEIVNLLREMVRPGDWVLVKGSRRMRMETVIEMLKEEA